MWRNFGPACPDSVALPRVDPSPTPIQVPASLDPHEVGFELRLYACWEKGLNDRLAWQHTVNIHWPVRLMHVVHDMALRKFCQINAAPRI